MARPILRTLLILPLLAAAVPATAAPEGTGLPVPRYVSLRAGEANMRTGPGKQYPIKWIYRRPGLPLEILDEHYTWRRVRDVQGTEGWMLGSMLSGKRSVVVIDAASPMILAEAAADGRPLARIETGAIAQLLQCPALSSWCEVKADGFRGWLRRSQMWGVKADETVK
jgi:SH3-like domain-containing protein